MITEAKKVSKEPGPVQGPANNSMQPTAFGRG
jgi:hypothetical protein